MHTELFDQLGIKLDIVVGVGLSLQLEPVDDELIWILILLVESFSPLLA